MTTSVRTNWTEVDIDLLAKSKSDSSNNTLYHQSTIFVSSCCRTRAPPPVTVLVSEAKDGMPWRSRVRKAPRAHRAPKAHRARRASGASRGVVCSLVNADQQRDNNRPQFSGRLLRNAPHEARQLRPNRPRNRCVDSGCSGILRRATCV